MAQLGPWEVGQILALKKEGFSQRQIAERVTKATEGKENPSFGSVGAAMRRLDAEPDWTGERHEGSGRKRKTTGAEDKEIVRCVKRFRGMKKMTSKHVRAAVPAAKKVSARTVRRRLKEGFLHWCRRRRKIKVPESALQPRLDWAAWVKRQREAYLKRWVYSDGITIYLARSAAESEDKNVAALGIYVWREHNSKDALFRDCIGPSSYAKGQGVPIRVWGLLVHGQLHISVLPAGQTMNRWNYEWMVRSRFKPWLGRRRKQILVQDHERCLWTDEPMQAMKDCKIQVLERHPKHSADLNAIENAWKFLRGRLDETLTLELESRDEFLVRLRSAVAWVNRNHKETFLQLGRNQKERAADVIDQLGGRTKW